MNSTVEKRSRLKRTSRACTKKSLLHLETSLSKGEMDMSRRIDIFVVILAGLSLSVFAEAQDACTTNGVAGNYVVTCNGYISPAPSAPMLPATLLASANAAKNGQWSGTGTLSLGGSIVTQDVKSVGPAQVNP